MLQCELVKMFKEHACTCSSLIANGITKGEDDRFNEFI